MHFLLNLLGGAGGNLRIAIQGQSNAMGTYSYNSALAAAPLSVSDPGLAAFSGVDIPRVFIWNRSAAAYQPLRIGTNNLAAALDMFGPELGLAVRWVRETTSGNLYIDKRGEGGQPITYFMSGTTFYSQFLTDHNNGTAWLAARSITARHMGWLWVQGEFDYLQTESWYRDNLDALTASRLAGGLQDAAGKLLLVQMRPGSNRYGAGVAAAKTAFAVANPLAQTMEMIDSFHTDNLHIDARGQLQLGYDAFERFFSRGPRTA
jgi:hypothetical protein